ncbi:T9SS type A sorting domain-containing protein [Flavobacterium psychrophilum]|uniref:T9SS type A sorting domain-containing protein n=1 Tax=Flavobacterium psychrophilum TaxID=96345 RepID=UPI001D091A69|nr:T9SS type A sorting domain-containing protein [Flavobacterium psychrophilum]MCB6062560.1 T9SS type A sorting domain-containing protein [Flavobacterium psychrophilum]
MTQKIILLFSMIFSSLCFSQIQFEDKILIHKDITPNDVNDFQIIDFDNDGKSDIISLSGQGNRKISFYKNEGNDIFSHHLLISTDNNFSNTNTYFLKVTDINNDGYYDLITNGVNRINVFINNGFNSFTEILVGYGTAINVNYIDVKITDIDNDGFKDIIAERKIDSSNSSDVYWFKNDNLNFYPFTITQYKEIPNFYDNENDGDLDVIFKNINGGISLINNNNNGTFSIPTILLSSSQINFSFDTIDIVDFNNDGLNDIVLYNNLSTNNIKLFIKQANNTYISQTIYIGNFNYINYFDYDNDNDIDIFTNRGTTLTNLNNSIYINNNLSFTNVIYINDGLILDNGNNDYYTGDKVQFTDINNDNIKDVVYCTNNRIGFLKNLTNNNFISKIISDFSMGIANICNIDNDNFIDIVLKETSDNTKTRISWFKNLGNLNFTQNMLDEDVGNGLSDNSINIECGDINNDGNVDLLTGRFYYYLQNGSINSTSTINSSLYPSFLIDFDHDNDLDIIGFAGNAGSGFGSNILLFKNNSTGTSFITQNLINSTALSSFKCVDIDNDNDYDIVQSGNSKIHINSNNSFVTSNLNTSLNSNSYTFGDIDNNGFNDIICSTGSTNPALKILYNTNNIFNEVSVIGNFKYPNISDIDNDGDLDIIGFNTSTKRSVLLINNNLSFSSINLGNYIRDTYSDYEINYNIVDIDNDGDKDVVMSSKYELIVYSSNLSALSTNDFELSNNNLYIYPNPVIDKFKINTTNNIYAIKLFDILGKEISAVNLSNNEINISFLNKGIYFLKIEFLNSTKTIRLVKN